MSRIKAQKCIGNGEYTVTEMRSFIEDIHEDCISNNLHVYSYGECTDEYFELGEIVHIEKPLNCALSLKW